MATEVEHIECANRTQLTIAHLLQDIGIHSPWIAVAAFYKAVHIVEAVFSSDKDIGHTSNHDQREQCLKGQRRYEKIFRHYSPLKRAAVNARYLSGCACFDDYLAPQQVVDKLLKHELHQIEQSAVNKLLKHPDSLDRILTLF
jgi:sulfur carrier protein ThiS